MKFTGVHYEGDEITRFATDTGEVLDFAKAYDLVKAGKVDGMITGASRSGRLTVKGVADGDTGNNLSSLSRF